MHGCAGVLQHGRFSQSHEVGQVGGTGSQNYIQPFHTLFLQHLWEFGKPAKGIQIWRWPGSRFPGIWRGAGGHADGGGFPGGFRRGFPGSGGGVIQVVEVSQLEIKAFTRLESQEVDVLGGGARVEVYQEAQGMEVSCNLSLQTEDTLFSHSVEAVQGIRLVLVAFTPRQGGDCNPSG